MTTNQQMTTTKVENMAAGLNATKYGNLTQVETVQTTTPSYYTTYTPCGYCDIRCTYYAIETCFTLGVIANAIVLLRVFQDKHLQNPTFVSIAACAFADLCFLVVNLSVSFDAVILTVTCDYPSKVYGNTHRIVKSIAWFSANGHVALLAILRYICLTFPLKANILLSTRRVVLLSGLVWLLGILVMGVLSVVIFFTDFTAGTSQEFQVVFWTTTYLMPLVTTVTLHVVKMYKVKKMTSETATENTKKLLQTMSRMVIIVVCLATVMPFPYIVDRVLRTIDPDIYKTREMSLHAKGVANALVLLNNSINPIMYAFVSEPFRMSLKRMLRFDRDVTEDSMVASMTSVTMIQKREMILQRMEE